MAKVLLIVEDDPLMSRLYHKAFSFQGYQVELSYDGEEGLRKLNETKPDLILLDIMMPKMNGLEMLEAIKANPATKSTPVVVLTNLAGQQEAKEAIEKGAVKYVVKSEHDPKEVVDMVKQILTSTTTSVVPQNPSSQ